MVASFSDSQLFCSTERMGTSKGEFLYIAAFSKTPVFIVVLHNFRSSTQRGVVVGKEVDGRALTAPHSNEPALIRRRFLRVHARNINC